MSLRTVLGIACVNALLVGCASHQRQSIYLDGDRLHTGTGATMSTGAGAGQSAPAAAQAPDKEQRGNTPVGVSRDGAKPAEGAIVDPTGAATKSKP